MESSVIFSNIKSVSVKKGKWETAEIRLGLRYTGPLGPSQSPPANSSYSNKRKQRGPAGAKEPIVPSHPQVIVQITLGWWSPGWRPGSCRLGRWAGYWPGLTFEDYASVRFLVSGIDPWSRPEATPHSLLKTQENYPTIKESI